MRSVFYAASSNRRFPLGLWRRLHQLTYPFAAIISRSPSDLESRPGAGARVRFEVPSVVSFSYAAGVRRRPNVELTYEPAVVRAGMAVDLTVTLRSREARNDAAGSNFMQKRGASFGNVDPHETVGPAGRTITFVPSGTRL